MTLPKLSVSEQLAAAFSGMPATLPVAVAGMCSLTDAQLRTVGIARAYALTDLELDPARCREQAGPLLEDLAERIAHDWITH